MKVFRINPEFRILRLTFHRKSASKCRISEIKLVSLITFFDFLNTISHLKMELLFFEGILLKLNSFKKFRILEILNFHP